jgi:hypothetical protein
MNNSHRKNVEHGDVAALAATIISIVLMGFNKGPYDPADLIVGLTLAFLIAGYVWDNPRTMWQSLTVCSIIGGVAVPIGCYFVEVGMVHLPFPQSLFPECQNRNCDASESSSNVHDAVGFGIWLAVFAVALIADRRRQKA